MIMSFVHESLKSTDLHTLRLFKACHVFSRGNSEDITGAWVDVKDANASEIVGRGPSFGVGLFND
jgi:hypothetical protein